jgi:OmpA-OmpF porin, OOP family
MNKCCMLLALLFLGAPAAFAQDDVAGSKDHPLFSRLPDYYIYSYDEKDFDEFEVPIELVDKEMKTKRLEGKKTRIKYYLKKGAKEIAPLQVVRNYETAAKKFGATTLVSFTKKKFRLEGWAISSSNGYALTMKFAKDGKEIWVSILPGDASASGGRFTLTVLESAEMAQLIQAGDIVSELNSKGRIALYINFDTGKDVIKSESLTVIDEIAKAMQSSPSLKVSVEGHTDNTGDPAGNQRLSEMRAKAVMNAIAAKGVAANRLSAKGFGRTKPVADNGAEDGRAKNRRVELVKQ